MPGAEIKTLFFPAVANAPDGFLFADLEGHVLYANDSALKTFGYAPGEIPALPTDRLTPDPEDARRIFAAALEQGHWSGNVACARKNKEEFQALLSLSLVRDEQGRPAAVLGVLRESSDSAERARSDFMAHMSHELRTPLNAVIGFAQVLQAEYYGRLNDKQKEYVKDILQSGRNLLTLINDILDLSKLDAGRMELAIAKVKLPDLLKRSHSLLKEKARAHAIRLELKLPPDLPEEISGDERKIKQVIFQILSNALKFSPDNGEVLMEARKISGEEIEISVTDSGPGIGAPGREKLFAPFARPDRAKGSAGLGLALSKRMVDLWSGRIGVVSPPEGRDRGSRFYFTIPIADKEPGHESIAG